MSTALNSPERLEQLRDLPRVTAADRERYKRWEQEARAELAEVEPVSARLERAYMQAAMSRKSWLVLRRPGDGDVPITRAEWRSHWRSLPDYDGPPMRAPSGVRWWSHEGVDGFRRLVLPLDTVHFLGAWTEHLIAAGAESRPQSAREKREFRAREVAHAYSHPSAGGRGWCPKLAEVDS